MRDSIQPAWLARSRRADLLAVALPLLAGLLVAACTGSPGTSPAPTHSARAVAASGCVAPPSSSCLAPRQLRTAYGIQPLLDSGTDGRGETVTVLAAPVAPAPSTTTTAPPPNAPAEGLSGEFPNVSYLAQDLAAFDSTFGLPAARIQMVTTLTGSASPGPASIEEVQDVEIVHAVAPAATLRVVLMPASALASGAHAAADMLAGVRLAVSGTDVAAIGWGMGEHFFTKAQAARMHSILRKAAADHVTVVAASGDNGVYSEPYGGAQVKEASLPAADPLVLAVGGTALTVNTVTGSYTSETVWNGNAGVDATGGASGGGFSHLYARPSYQDGIHGISAKRGVPDVAGDASGTGGAAIVFASGGKTFVDGAAGTGAAAMLWGGLMALADQYAQHGLGLVNPAIYRIGRSSAYHKAFHDVTSGNNLLTGSVTGDVYHAGPGWDPVTGWGSPNAQVLIPRLAH
jgi:subtilase family serine protease